MFCLYQVVATLVIDFEITCEYFVLNTVCSLGYRGEKLAEHSWYEAALFPKRPTSRHSVGFTASSLSVGKYCSVVAVKEVHDQRGCHF